VNTNIRVVLAWRPHEPGRQDCIDASRTVSTEPRILLNSGGGVRGAQGAGQTGVSITAYTMSPGEEQVVADRIHVVLSAPRTAKPATEKPPAGDLTDRWAVLIEFAAGTGDHVLHVRQQGSRLNGTHQGDFVSREFSGSIAGDDVSIASNIGEVHGAALSYRFNGRLTGDTITGTVDMGESMRDSQRNAISSLANLVNRAS